MLERLPAVVATRPRVVTLALLRAYTLIMIALLLARVGTLIAR
jgi:hypothetical protein